MIWMNNRIVMNETSTDALLNLGAKARNLNRMAEAGITVPQFVAIPASTWECADSDVLEPCCPLLRNTCERIQSANDPFVVDLNAAQARDIILNMNVSEKATEIIKQWVNDNRFENAVLVRSSALSEDVSNSSSAGQYSSVISRNNVGAINEAYRIVVASYFGDRAVAYRKAKQISQYGPHMGVIIQKLVRPWLSGIVFGCDPITSDHSRITIEVSHGFGQIIVSGEVTPDRFVVSRDKLSVVERVAGSKRIREELAGDGSLIRTETKTNAGSELSIDDEKAIEIALAYLKVERVFSKPQDVEFCIDGERLWIVQSRDITA